MKDDYSTWTPKYVLTPSIARGLMQIEAARALVDHTPLSPAVEAELRSRARVRAAHFSTFIEGNRLTLEEARAVIADERTEISGRERDVSEVRNYWNALLKVEDLGREEKAPHRGAGQKVACTRGKRPQGQDHALPGRPERN